MRILWKSVSLLVLATRATAGSNPVLRGGRKNLEEGAGCMVVVACGPGFRLVGADSDGCGGTCKEKKSCKIVTCAPGFHLINTNKRGCKGECVAGPPPPCMIVDCAPGFKLVAADSNGCGGTCKEKSCKMVTCAPGFHSIKTDKRGCGGECEEEPCLVPLCLPGSNLINTDSRGCGGECEEPCAIVDCAPGFNLINTNSRGCGGECEEPCAMLDCAPGSNLINTDSRGCGGECEEEPCAIVDCAPGSNLINTDSRGCGGECVTAPLENCDHVKPTCELGDRSISCFCPKVYDPVCGCDGVLYENSCVAECAGVKAKEEPCLIMDCAPGFTLINADSRGCGGECEEELCVMILCAPGSNLINTDSRGCGGECVTAPLENCDHVKPTCELGDASISCFCPEIYDPVCGCDGVLYENSCVAECAGVKAKEEPCLIMDCAPGFTLINADSRGCGGECVTAPLENCDHVKPTCELGDKSISCFCPMIYDPVCGCDGILYENSCMAGCARGDFVEQI